MNDVQLQFLLNYADRMATDIAAALVETSVRSEDFAEWCKGGEFVGGLHHIFISVEQSPAADPAMLPPTPPCAIDFAAMGIDQPNIVWDPYGPTYDRHIYNHEARAFADGTKMSDVTAGQVQWFNPAADWKLVDRQVAAAAAEVAA